VVNATRVLAERALKMYTLMRVEKKIIEQTERRN
jgi:hypothetical protein